MRKIRLLSNETIDKIAAGEVVERPSSVVKELVENSIDSGAKNITVEWKDGGISYIRVTDDGCGIEKDELRNAFLRHSTSKLSSAEDDLSSVTTPAKVFLERLFPQSPPYQKLRSFQRRERRSWGRII